jgi:hypothetical protein
MTLPGRHELGLAPETAAPASSFRTQLRPLRSMELDTFTRIHPEAGYGVTGACGEGFARPLLGWRGIIGSVDRLDMPGIRAGNGAPHSRQRA